MGCHCSKPKNQRLTRYKPKRAKSIGAPPMEMRSVDVLNPSNSVEIAEVALITNGFKPDFENNEEGKFNQVPTRTMKTRKMKKKNKNKKGKRVLKRVCYNATSQQSSYSDLVSEYVLESVHDLELNSNFIDEYSEQLPTNRIPQYAEPIREESNESENEDIRREENGYHHHSDQPESLSEKKSNSSNERESSQEELQESIESVESVESEEDSSEGEGKSEESESDSVPSDNISDSDSNRYLSPNKPARSSSVFRQ
ncbi:unnamed protein product [Moneuplotes crassus]|uniref:Uncharacterized protein n=1 Tax=Euplotes crassus TaxID=5936 RepID=A0AAD1XFM5_EUPCR|nr:unnamed protein product [Moneuplotes crassus]